MERGENDGEADDSNIGTNQADSDSEFENKGSRANKMSRVSYLHSILQKICFNVKFQIENFQQRNFKQRIVALLKRFRVPPEELDEVRRSQVGLSGERDLETLFQELESLSCGEGDESGQDIDNLSIGSTPKPSLRPFFTNSRTQLQENIMGMT